MTTISIKPGATAFLKQQILLAIKFSNTVRGLVEKTGTLFFKICTQRIIRKWIFPWRLLQVQFNWDG